MATTIAVSTRRYEQVHGHKPRGYGLWYFALPGGVTFSHAGLYHVAVRSISRQAERTTSAPDLYIQVCA
jgi:hypothetical protein